MCEKSTFELFCVTSSAFVYLLSVISFYIFLHQQRGLLSAVKLDVGEHIKTPLSIIVVLLIFQLSRHIQISVSL